MADRDRSYRRWRHAPFSQPIGRRASPEPEYDQLVYTQLRDEGLVTMQKGRGTQVTDGLETQQLRKERMPMQGIVENAVREAKAEGFGLQPFFLASLAYILLHNPRPAGKLRILFVECEGHDYPFYRQAIEKSAGAEVETLFLDECSRPGHEIAEIVQRNHIIVTTLNHADEVKTAFAPYDRKVVVIGATVDSAALLEISRLEHGTNVAFVCSARLAATGWPAGSARRGLNRSGTRPSAGMRVNRQRMLTGIWTKFLHRLPCSRL